MLAFVFPGQGSQEVGMGQALAQSYPAARQVFEQADEILGFALSRLCFEGPEAHLNDTINTQAALFTTSVAALMALRAAGYTTTPHFVAGHSLGEYSAYVAAAALPFEAGLRLVRERGRLMKNAGELNPGGMAAILKLEDDEVAKICQEASATGDGLVQIANYNSPGQIVISGHNAAVERAIQLALAAKARRAVKLPVSIAAHSELMRVIADDFRQAVEAVPLTLPQIPVVANITARPLASVQAIRAEMQGQLTASVRWSDSISWMVAQGVTHFIEIGSKDVLAGLIKRISKEVQTHTVGTPANISTLVEA